MTLDQIRARQRDCQTYNFGLFNADKLAKEDVPLLLAAVDAVLAEIAVWEREAGASSRIAKNLRESPVKADMRVIVDWERHATISNNLTARLRSIITRALETK